MKAGSSSMLWTLVIVAIIAVPQASQTITQEANVTRLEGLQEAASNSESPVNIVSKTDSTSSNMTVTSHDEEKTVRTTHDRKVTVQETPDYRVKTVETPGKVKTVLNSSEGLLIEINSSQQDRTEVHGPEGELVEKTVNGERVMEFDGTDLEALKDRKEELNEILSEETVIAEVSSRESDGPSLDLYVQPDTSVENGEYLRIRNTGDENISLNDWRVEDEAGTGYTFEDGRIDAGESIRLYTDYGDAEFNWDRGLAVWSMNGDTAYIYDEDGELVAEESYE